MSLSFTNIRKQINPKVLAAAENKAQKILAAMPLQELRQASKLSQAIGGKIMKLADITKNLKNIKSYLDNKTTVRLADDLSYESKSDWLHLKTLLGALEKNKTVTELDLSSCDITDEQLEEIIPLLKKAPSITKLSLDDNNLTDKSLDNILTFIEKEKEKEKKLLQKILLSENQFSEKNVQTLITCIQSVGLTTNLCRKKNPLANILIKDLNIFSEKKTSKESEVSLTTKKKIPPITLAENLDETTPEDLQKVIESVSPKTRDLLQSMIMEIIKKQQKSSTL